MTFGLEMYRKHCLSPAANSTPDWTDTRANLSFSRQGRLIEPKWLAPDNGRRQQPALPGSIRAHQFRGPQLEFAGQSGKTIHSAGRSGVGLVGVRSFNFVLRFSNSLYVMAGIASPLWVLLALMVPGIVRAQVAGGSVTGTARGESGAAVPGVQLTIKDVTTGEVRTV